MRRSNRLRTPQASALTRSRNKLTGNRRSKRRFRPPAGAAFHGELGKDNSFYFRGPRQKLNLRAQNLAAFVQLADGLDEETWLYHLNRGDYSRWFREGIKDEELADEAVQYEHQASNDARTSREGIKAAIERRYTAPA